MKDQVKLTAKLTALHRRNTRLRSSVMFTAISASPTSVSPSRKRPGETDYITALRDFWGAFYNLRYLSLYDFEKGMKIVYR